MRKHLRGSEDKAQGFFDGKIEILVNSHGRNGQTSDHVISTIPAINLLPLRRCAYALRSSQTWTEYHLGPSIHELDQIAWEQLATTGTDS